MVVSQFIKQVHHSIVAWKTALCLVFSVIFMIFNAENSLASQNKDSCQAEIVKYEQIYQIPTGLLASIAKIESGFNPYALNDGERGYFFANKELLIEKANELINAGHTSFDVGCLQLNYGWHGKHFNSISEMINNEANVGYAAKLLSDLYKYQGSWQKAVRLYHSNIAKHHKPYSRKVILAWMNHVN